MKKGIIYLLLLFFPLMGVGCEEPNTIAQETLSKLHGTWQWSKTSYPRGENNLITPDSVGYNQFYTFHQHNAWTLIINDKLVGEGTLEVKEWEDTIGNKGSFIYIDLYNELTGETKSSFVRFYTEGEDTFLVTSGNPYLGGGGVTTWKKISSK